MIKASELPTNFPIVPLGDVVEFLDHMRRPVTKKDRVSGPYPYYGANGQQDSVADYLFDEPLILLAEDGGNFDDPNRKIAYQVNGKCWVNNHAHVLRPKPIIDIRYLSHHLESYDVTSFINGATRAKLNKSSALEISISLPPLDEQKRIAGILDKAEGLRRKRARAITLTNTLLRSVFLDMFGDPVTNPMGWEVGTIRDLLKEAKYGTSQKANVEKLGIPVLRMGNITYQGEIDLSDLKHVEMSGKDLQKYTTQKDDILFNRTNSKELVGKTAIVTFNDPVAFAGYLVRGRVNSRADSYYISAYLNSVHGKTTLQSMCKSIVGMANINAQELQNIKIQIPPIELQKSFRLKVETVLAQRETFKTSLERINTLTAALTQRAFKGELTGEDANG